MLIAVQVAAVSSAIVGLSGVALFSTIMMLLKVSPQPEFFTFT